MKPKPITVNQLQSWLGVANYYRKYIQNYAEIAQPLYDLMGLKNVPKNCRKKNGAVDGKKVNLEWNEKAEENFYKIQQILCSNLILALPNFDEIFELSTDASEFGYGAVLEQEVNGERRPIAYFSRSYTPTQRKYATPEKELLALVMAVEYFHQYLYGKHFKVHTDHQPLTWISTKKNVHPRLERWIMRLSIYSFDIVYKPGSENIVPDCFSRIEDENNVDHEAEDYLDNLVAAIDYEQSESDEEPQAIEVSSSES